MNDRTKAAAIGGAVAGVLSIIPVINYCCVLWAIGGGVLAVFMYLRGAGGPMTPGDGAKLGVRAGIIAAVIYLIIALPMMLLMGGAMMSDAMQRAGGEQALGAGALAGLGVGIVFVAAVILIGFTTLGGLIGAAIFGKGAGAAPPPPPPAPGFGGPTGGPAGGGYGGPAGGSYGQGS
ncbi:MAG TPA: hypothetical protein VG148_00660 [Pyrinomonadaceae bacterium]|nr:hypothetical protein [Pyrinomonadaceae bacterium]